MMFVILLLSVLSTAQARQSSTKSFTSEQIWHKGKTAVAVKQGIDDYTDAMPVGISDFKELTLKSKIFIDNTLFCYDIIARIHHRRFLVTIVSPSQWGKTTLLTTLKTFLGIQVDEMGKEIVPRESTNNYRLFNNSEIIHADGTIEHLQAPLLISQEADMMKHQGKYPIIHLSFKHATGGNYDQIEQQISLAVSEAYKQHAYMIKRFEQKIKSDPSCWGFARDEATSDLQKFHHYLRTSQQVQLKLSDLRDALEFLNRALHEYFTKRCYLLIDDYDTPLISSALNHQFPKTDEIKLWDQFKEFMTAISKYSQFENTVLMGTVGIKFQEFEKMKWEFILDEHFTSSNQLRWSPFREYFGFKELHVQYIFQKYNITDQLAQQAELWYSGFASQGLRQHFYHPSSIVKFLHHKKIAYYRPPDQYTNFVTRVFKESPVQKNVLYRLFGKQYITPSFNELGIFQRNHKDDTQLYSHTSPELFHAILWFEQFVSCKLLEMRRKILPNTEVAYMMSNWLISSYKQKCQIDDKLLDQAANTLLQFVTTETTIQPLKESLEQLYKNSLLDVPSDWKDDNEDPAHSIFNCVALRMQCISNFQQDVYYANTKIADLVIHDDTKKIAIVIEIRTNQLSAQIAYNSAANVTKVVRPLNVHQIQLIGINIFANKTIDILAKYSNE